ALNTGVAHACQATADEYRFVHHGMIKIRVTYIALMPFGLKQQGLAPLCSGHHTGVEKYRVAVAFVHTCTVKATVGKYAFVQPGAIELRPREINAFKKGSRQIPVAQIPLFE